jgi:hypothetical protein
MKKTKPPLSVFVYHLTGEFLHEKHEKFLHYMLLFRVGGTVCQGSFGAILLQQILEL